MDVITMLVYMLAAASACSMFVMLGLLWAWVLRPNARRERLFNWALAITLACAVLLILLSATVAVLGLLGMI